MPLDDSALRHEVRVLVDDIVAGKFQELRDDGRIGRLTPDELSEAIHSYGRTLVGLPNEVWDLVDEYPADDGSGEVGLDVPMWTAEEGRSDLTLSLTALRSDGGYSVQIDDLHVL